MFRKLICAAIAMAFLGMAGTANAGLIVDQTISKDDAALGTPGGFPN